MRYGIGRSPAFDLIVGLYAGLELPCLYLLFLEIDFVPLLVVRNLLCTGQMPHAAFGYVEQQGDLRSVECFFRRDEKQPLDAFKSFLYSHVSSSSCIIFDISGISPRASQYSLIRKMRYHDPNPITFEATMMKSQAPNGWSSIGTENVPITAIIPTTVRT